MQRRNQRLHVSHFEGVLGTSLEVRCVPASRWGVLARREAGRAERAVLDEIERLDRIFSVWRPDSEFSHWRATFDEAVPVSPELAEVLDAARAWRASTRGAFDPTVEAWSRLWRERAKRAGDRHAALSRPHSGAGYAHREYGLAAPAGRAPGVGPGDGDELWKVAWNGDRTAALARKLTPLPVDLDAVAKGYIIDRACLAAVRASRGLEVLVNVGGDLRHVGGHAITVGVADPFGGADNAPPVARVRLCNQGLATSGGYRRGYRVAGRWHSHVLDPRDGRPADAIVSATVVAGTAVDADALATAFSVLPPDESVALADSLSGVGCLLICRDGRRVVSSYWHRRAGVSRAADSAVVSVA